MATYATWDPAAKGANVTLSNGNLTASIASTTIVRSTIGKAAGKWYWEITATSTRVNHGVDNTSELVSASYVASTANGWSYYYTGVKINNATQTAYGAAYTTNDVIGVALDMDAGTLTFLKNNVSQGVAFSGLTSTLYAAIGSDTGGTASATANFGASAMAYAPPAGYNAGLYTVTPPVTDFSGTPLSGEAPLSVAFTDSSTNTPTSWLWDFGDGGSDTVQNPTYIYTTAGTYTVTLTATNAGGSDAEIKTDYITVSAADTATVAPSGGIPAALYARARSAEEVKRERQKLGILPPDAQEVVETVAAQQAKRLEQDAQKRFEELARELELRGIEWDARYLESLNYERERLINAEIAMRLRRRLQDEEELMLLVLMAAAA